MKIFCCFLLMLLGINTAAQEDAQQYFKKPPYILAVNINPLTLINADQRMMAGVERHLKGRWAAVFDAGIVVHSNYIDNARQTNGFELRPALRYYYDHGFASYIQVQAQYRLVRYQMHDWLGKDCVNDVPAYERLQDFIYQKQQIGGAFVTGGIIKLGQRLLFDISVGIGAQYRSYKVADEEACCYIPLAGFWGNRQAEDAWVGILPTTLKLVYVIK